MAPTSVQYMLLCESMISDIMLESGSKVRLHFVIVAQFKTDQSKFPATSVGFAKPANATSGFNETLLYQYYNGARTTHTS